MNRFEAIISLVDKCNTVADIGTDHGYVAEMLLKDQICSHIIATDVNVGPLNSAKKHLTSIGFSDKSDFRLGSGLTVLEKDEADVAVIAGMGGELIAKILDDSMEVTKSLNSIVIQPMTNIDTIRRFIYENNMSIEQEVIVKEYHFYYFIMKIVNKPDNTISNGDDIYFTISKYLFDKKDSLLLEYMQKLYKNNKIILDNLQNSKKDNTEQKVLTLEKQNKKLELMIKSYEDNRFN